MSRKDTALCLILLGIVGAVYVPAFPGAFHFDDFPFVLENPMVVGEDFPWHIFVEAYGGRPLTIASFFWNFHRAGPSPVSYLLVNLLLHLAVVALLFAFLLRCGEHTPVAASAALLFGVHPLATQAVEYIWSRSVTAATVLGLAALLTAKRRWVSLGFFQAALWSRFDAVLWAVPLFFANRRLGRLLAGLIVLNAGLLAYGAWVHGTTGFLLPRQDWMKYWAGIPAAYLQSLELMFRPSRQALVHPAPPADWAWVVGGLLVLTAVGGILVWLRRHDVALFTSLAAVHWFVLPILLVPNPVHISEARLYPALAAFSWALMRMVFAHLVPLLLSLRPQAGDRIPARRPALVVAAAICLISASGTLQRHPIWNDDVALWREAAERAPGLFYTHYNLGVALVRERQLDAAEDAFRRALRLNPQDDMSYAALAYCLELRGNPRRASVLYELALKLEPTNRFAADGLERVAVCPRVAVRQEGDEFEIRKPN
jgi:tetratricopeptide (TPR) repeat protein